MHDWLFEHNLHPWLEIISGIVGYQFDSLDWDAVWMGISDTDAEAARWFDYPIGNSGLTLHLARNPQECTVMFRLDDLQGGLGDQVSLATEISQSYELKRRG